MNAEEATVAVLEATALIKELSNKLDVALSALHYLGELRNPSQIQIDHVIDETLAKIEGRDQ